MSPCLETPVRNAFGVADAAGRPCYGMASGLVGSHVLLTTLVSEMPLLYASSPLLPLHLHNLHKQREGRTARGVGSVGEAELRGGLCPIAFGHVERQTRQYEGSSCHSRLWWLHAETPLRHAERQRKDPTPPLRLRSQAEYRHNRNKAESLSTLEVHWSKTLAWLFINQLSLANCLLRWTAQACGTLQHQPQDSKTVDIMQLKIHAALTSDKAVCYCNFLNIIIFPFQS